MQGFDRSVRSIEDTEKRQPSGVATKALFLFTLGSILMCALWLYGWLYMRRILRYSQPLESPVIAKQVAEYVAQLKLRTIPQVRVSNQVPIGAMVGCFRHVLILHSSWPQWTQNELRAVLVHELAHAARRDFLWVVISSWVRILFFFHPLVQLVVKRLRLEQELAADQLAAGIMENANAYGRALASLALRSQNATRAPSPMLSAEQVCIVRRITMLKHGSLMPRRTLMRWASCLTLGTLLLSLPLSGLRGTPPDDTVLAIDQKPKTAGKSEADEEAIRKEKQAASDALARANLAREVEQKYPRLRLQGPMIWNPGRFQSSKLPVDVRWMHYVYTVMALGGYPQSGEAYGSSILEVAWSDLAREHGRFMTSASIKQADQILPGMLSQFFESPQLGPHTLTDNTKVIEGRTAAEVVFKTPGDPPVVHQLDSWVIDDEQGFVHGTELEVAQIIRGEVNPFAEVPEAFLADYKVAAFATVYDCRDWDKKVRDFYVGSPEQAQWAMAAPLLKGLTQLGVFVQGRDTDDYRMRAVYVDEHTASQAKAVIDGLLVLARTALSLSKADSDLDQGEARMCSELLQSVRVEVVRSEVKIAFDSPSFFSLTPDESQVPGWIAFLEDRAKLTDERNAVRIDGQPFGCFGGFLPQSIAAKSYCGKRVRLVAELGTHPDAAQRAGLFLWTSGQQDRTLAFNSRSIDGKSSMPMQMKFRDQQDYLKDTDVKWSTTSIELDVPVDSQVLSFGAYTKNADLCVRNVKLEVIGDALATATVEEPWLPYNLFVIPGHELLSAPRNLDFSEPTESKSTDVEQVADKKTESVVR